MRYKPLLLLVLFSCFLGLSAAYAGTSGEVSIGIARRLYCYAYSLFYSEWAKFIGSIFAVLGVILILKQKILYGLWLIAIGAFINTLPSLGESFISGISNFLYQTGLSSSRFDPQISGFNGFYLDPSDISNCDKIYVPPFFYDDTTEFNRFTGSTASEGLVPVTSDVLGADTFSSGAAVNGCDDFHAKYGNKKCPPALARNNPGNIECRNGLPGMVSCAGRWAVFGTMQQGIDAMIWQLKRYATISGRYKNVCTGRDLAVTLTDFICVYAPPRDGNDVGNYTKVVSNYMRKRGVDVNPNTVVPLNDSFFMNLMVRAQIKMETGVDLLEGQ